MRVFVTGATGFVGRYVVRELLSRGHEVHCGVRSTEKLRSLFGEEVKGYEVNFDSVESLYEVLNFVRPEAVIHLIGILFELPSKGITFERVHHAYTRNLVEASRRAGVEKFVFMSALGTHDRAPSRYHRTKRAAEKEVISSGLRYTVFRPSLILGPEQRLFSDLYGITKYLPVVALPDFGRYRFQPVDVRDVACAFATSLEKKETDGKIYELCGTKAVSFRELLTDIFSYWNRKVLMIPMPRSVMYFLGLIVEKVLEPPPFSSDQMRMMWVDNICGILGDEAVSEGIKEVCGREPIPYEESLSWSLENFAKMLK
ncbi:MAG: complex I NDUFA9 subunit family protein [Aquificae bacterium]|nr:complex I NDUFA9 subunit family protein [Aquificota bacterium]